MDTNSLEEKKYKSFRWANVTIYGNHQFNDSIYTLQENYSKDGAILDYLKKEIMNNGMIK